MTSSWTSCSLLVDLLRVSLPEGVTQYGDIAKLLCIRACLNITPLFTSLQSTPTNHTTSIHQALHQDGTIKEKKGNSVSVSLKTFEAQLIKLFCTSASPTHP